MKRNALLCLAVALLITMFQPPQPIHADHQHGPTITVDQLNAVFRRVPFSSPLASKPIQHRFINIVDGQFRISFQTVGARNPDFTYTYIWLNPSVQAGKIICTITQIKLADRVITQDDLMHPNPYLADLNADAYCNSFLSPFLVSYGPNAVVNSITLKYYTVVIDLGGTLLTEALNPVIVAGCSVYAVTGDINIRSGAGKEYNVIKVIKGMFWLDELAPVLDWRNDWLKISYKGIVGWIWKYYAYCTDECRPNYYESSEAWRRSTTP